MAKIVKDKPPIWEAAKKAFDFDERYTIFSWGDIIYNPGGIDVDEFLIAHEGTHQRQQEAIGGPHPWWMRYIGDAVFRCEMEAQAYAVQYNLFCKKNKDREVRSRYLGGLAHDLASGMYKLTIPQADARAAILKRSLL